MSGYDLPGPDKRDSANGEGAVVRKASILRLQLSIPPGSPPKVTGRTVVASGFGEQAIKDVFLIGPTGLALVGSTLHASDAVGNRIVAILDATTRSGTAGTGRVVTKGGKMQRPLALIATPEGHLITSNALRHRRRFSPRYLTRKCCPRRLSDRNRPFDGRVSVGSTRP
jgi:hypothetical protein